MSERDNLVRGRRRKAILVVHGVLWRGKAVTGPRRVEGIAAAIEMTRMERSKVPLRNFTLPLSLKWGDQRTLVFRKPPVNSSDGDVAVRGCGSNRSLSMSYVEEGIDELREKIMPDFRTAADRMKHEFSEKSQQRVSPRNDEVDEKEEEDFRSRSRSPARRSPAVEEKKEEGKMWNLRTRKASGKAPALSNSNFSAGKSEGAKLPTVLRIGEEKEEEVKKREKETSKLSVKLSRKEVEEDFKETVGHLPPRRPKKRSRPVQGQFDTLSPGLWLTKVTADMYSVRQVPDTGKR